MNVPTNTAPPVPRLPDTLDQRSLLDAGATEHLPVTAGQDAVPALAERDGMTLPARGSGSPAEIAGAILELSARPDIRLDVLQVLKEWQQETAEQQRKQQYLQALAGCQEEIKPVARDAENKQTKSWYAREETIDTAIRPIYTRYGFVLTTTQVKSDTAGHVKIRCACSHGPSGHTEYYDREGPLDMLGPQGKPVKTAIHGQMSTETLLTKALIRGIFNVKLAAHDDDGNRGGMTFVTPDQTDELYDLAKPLANFEESRFLETHAPGAHTFSEVEARDFARLANLLKLLGQKQAKGRQE